jgi:hypothetical protein
MGQGKALLAHVEEKLYELYGPASIRKLPEGLRLEMHPSVRHVLWQDPDLTRYTDQFTDVTAHFSLPVRFTVELDALAWRLVIVTEEVIDGGQVAP